MLELLVYAGSGVSLFDNRGSLQMSTSPSLEQCIQEVMHDSVVKRRVVQFYRVQNFNSILQGLWMGQWLPKMLSFSVE